MSWRYLLFLLLLPAFCFSQKASEKDSVKTIIRDAESDSVKAIHYLDLGDLYQHRYQDSAIFYFI